MTQQKIAILDYGGGNIRSVERAVQHVITQHALPMTVHRVADAPDLLSMDRIILPGQGAFQDCMTALEGKSGMIATLEKKVNAQQTPFLGICVGLQLMMERGFEHGVYRGLGWLKGDVVPIAEVKNFPSSLKIPHMGWNDVQFVKHPLTLQGHDLMKNMPENPPHFYFVHSFMVESKEEQDVIGWTEYGVPIPAMMASGCMAGIQCHPEKSQVAGMQFLRNFLLWSPANPSIKTL